MGGKGKGKGKGYRKRKRKDDGDIADGETADGEADAKKRPRNDIWREESGNWELKNEAYESYYTRQRVCSEEEWPLLLQHLRTGLPVAIRVNRMRTGASAMCARLAEMQAVCGADPLREFYAPQPLTWYPHNLAWQWLGLERRTIKKDKNNKALKDFLSARERTGLISRQEAVSMVPPLFLGAEPHHFVLDLCAAPGSKTSQIIEAMHWPSCAHGAEPPSGLVLANELQWKRANMLAHQVQRQGSPCAAVVNMDAHYFPELWYTAEDGSKQRLLYDRVLCDVPCSGDGTMRKTPYIWKSWTLKDGLSLHVRQMGILHRGLELLKIGGRLVYSTCSLNPMEDEAVVAAVLHRHAEAIALVEPPELPGYKGAKCLERWEVPDPSGVDPNTTTFYSDFDSVPEELKECKCKLLPSMFPPTGPGSDVVSAAVRDKCRRMLPHLMDTGGFFCAIFEKRAELKPSAKARRDHQHLTRKSQTVADSSAVPVDAATNEATCVEADVGGSVCADAGVPTAPIERVAPQGMRKVTKDYGQVDDKIWNDLTDFYGLDASLSKRFVARLDGDQISKVFLQSEGVARLLGSETRMPTRMVLCGVAAFQMATAYHERASRWDLMQQGLPALVALGMRRRLVCSKSLLVRLLREKELPISELHTSAISGEVQGLDALIDSHDVSTGALRPGSLAAVLRGSEDGQAPFMVLASLSESMLELRVSTAAEISSLLEDLEGPPPLEELFAESEAKDANSDAEQDKENCIDDAAVDDAEPSCSTRVDTSAEACSTGHHPSAAESGADTDDGLAKDADATSAQDR